MAEKSEKVDFAGISKETQEMVQNNIREAEKEKRYNDEVQPPDYSRMLKVTPEFQFLPKSPLWLVWSFLIRTVVLVFSKAMVWFAFGGSVKGRKNLKGIKSAILVCNHVHNLDNMIVRWGVRGHKLYITVADFNNMKGIIGSIMRAGGTMPFSDSFTGMKNLAAAVSTVLKKNHYVLYYPEKAMWPRYEKPRPFLDGAFHTAVSNKVPVIPMFIVFKDPPAWRRIFSSKKVGTLYILEPVYMDENLSRKENIVKMRDEAFSKICECYKEHFGGYPDTMDAKPSV